MGQLTEAAASRTLSKPKYVPCILISSVALDDSCFIINQGASMSTVDLRSVSPALKLLLSRDCST